MTKVRITIFYEDGIRHRVVKPGDPVHIPMDYVKRGLPRSIMLEKERRK